MRSCSWHARDATSRCSFPAIHMRSPTAATSPRSSSAPGVDFEAVPGMTVEMAAPVMSGIPLTIEGRSASVGIGLVRGAETIVLRLASGWWESGISKLLADGRTPETPGRADPQPRPARAAPRGSAPRRARAQGGDVRSARRRAARARSRRRDGRAPRHAVEAAAARPPRPDHARAPPDRAVPPRAGRPRARRWSRSRPSRSSRCRPTSACARRSPTSTRRRWSSSRRPTRSTSSSRCSSRRRRRARAARLQALRDRPGDGRIAWGRTACAPSS